MTRKLKVVVIIFINICIFYLNTSSAKNFVRLTNAHCESFNKSWVVINECRLRAKKRDLTVLNINISFRYPAHNIKVNAFFMKKANGYRPFVMNSTVDACEYIIKKNDPVGNYVYKFYKHFSNINHTCPYVGDQIVKNLNPNVHSDIMKLVFPNGDYVLMLSWYLTKMKTFVTNVYFTFNS